MKCRACGEPVEMCFLDLGSAPPSNAFLSVSDLSSSERWYPLKLFTCSNCYLVQVADVADPPSLFDADYAYFSSFSKSWVDHARRFVEKAQATLELSADSFVVEIACNDGYLLQHVRDAGIPCLGIEPTLGTAKVSRERGIETWVEFFGYELATKAVREKRRADLIVANNVLAHVPDLNDFVSGMVELLSPQGVVSIEFPHLLNLVEQRQFDTVYHEHFSYFSLGTVAKLLASHGLRVWNVERLETHGGSLRVWASHQSSAWSNMPSVSELLERERVAGMCGPGFYQGFQKIAESVKNELLEFLLDQSRSGRSVCGYGAAAKGNTLLNFAGIRRDLLDFVVDASPYKQGKFLPGSRIPIVDETLLKSSKPDLILILPWNLREEISAQLAYARDWGARFAVAVPNLQIF